MIDYMHDVTRSSSIEATWDLHCKQMASYGFDRIIYAYTRFRTEDSVGLTDDALFLSNHNPTYIDQFIETQKFIDAPMTEWALSNVGARSWGEFSRQLESLTDKQRSVVEFNISHGVMAGYSIRFADSNPRAIGIMALTAEPGMTQDQVDEVWRDKGKAIEVMNYLVHLKILALPHRTNRGELTERQREVLSWIGDGKSNLDVATILGVSVATVEKHLRLARERLGVETTAQAVLKASFQNQIYTF